MEEQCEDIQINAESINDPTDGVYEVEKIVGMSKKKGEMRYKVRWKGYGPADDTWENEGTLVSCFDLIDEYKKQKCLKEKMAKQRRKEQIVDAALATGTEIKRKPSFIYVEEDTLKDSFWKDLDEGRVNVFDTDLYSRVKASGRAAKDTDISETEDKNVVGSCLDKKESTKRRSADRVNLPKKRVKYKVGKVGAGGASLGLEKSNNIVTPSSSSSSTDRISCEVDCTSGLDEIETHRHLNVDLTDMSNLPLRSEQNVIDSASRPVYDVGKNGELETVEIDVGLQDEFAAGVETDITTNDPVVKKKKRYKAVKVSRGLVIKVNRLSVESSGEHITGNDYNLKTKQKEKTASLKGACILSVKCEGNVTGKLSKASDKKKKKKKKHKARKTKTRLTFDTPTEQCLTFDTPTEQCLTFDTPTEQCMNGTGNDSRSSLSHDETDRVSADYGASLSGASGLYGGACLHKPTLDVCSWSSHDSGITDPSPTSSEFSIAESPRPCELNASLDMTKKYDLNSFIIHADTVDDENRPTRSVNAYVSSLTTSMKSSVLPLQTDTELRCRDETSLEGELDDVKTPETLSTSEQAAVVAEHSLLSPGDVKSAVLKGEFEKVKRALDTQYAGKLETVDPTGMVLLMVAAQKGYDDIVDLLISHGSCVNAQQKNGTTALMLACEQGHLSTAEYLVEVGGACVNLQQTSGETALIKAVRHARYDVVKFLLYKGANYHAHTLNGNHAVSMAKHLATPRIESLITAHRDRISEEFHKQVTTTLTDTARLLNAIFPIQCFPLSDGPRFSVIFNHDLTPDIPGIGYLLFVAHTRMSEYEVSCRMYGPCAITSASLNQIPQYPVPQNRGFVLTCHPLRGGKNEIVINTVTAPASKTKLIICAYKAELYD